MEKAFKSKDEKPELKTFSERNGSVNALFIFSTVDLWDSFQRKQRNYLCFVSKENPMTSRGKSRSSGDICADCSAPGKGP